MSFFKNMAVNFQLNLITLFALIGFLVVGAVYYTNINVQKGFQQSQLRDIEGVSYVNAIKVGFLQERRNEKDFLLRKDMKYVNRHALVAENVLSNFEKLKSIHTEAGYDSKIDEMRDSFNAYTTQFVKVVDNWQAIGLTPKQGLRGKLRAAVHSVEAKLEQLDKPRLAVVMLMMRRHEKDFFMRLDEKYVERQDMRLIEFHEVLGTTNDISIADKNSIKAMLDGYLAAFKEVSLLMLQDVVNRKQMSKLYAEVKPQLDELNEEGNASALAATEALQENITSTFFRITSAMVLIALIVATFSSVIARGIVKPIKLLTQAMGRLAKGDLEIRIPAQRYTNEIGEMSAALSVFKENAIQVVEMREERKKERDRSEKEQRSVLNKMAAAFEQNVGGAIKSVGQAATELQANATQMSSTASQTSTQSKTVATAAKEASSNVQTVAVVVEELSASVNEISNHAQKSNDIANSAANQADETKKSVEAMVGEVSKIGAVVSLISDIAEQTNLLALNATIEAARAGSAGKGFAIVASEVKNLASQTAQATEEISSQVGKLQTVTDSTASEIDEIGRIIYEIDEISTAISVAVEEQSSATAEIARSVHHAAKGSEAVSVNIQSVELATDETGSAATQISTSATELSTQSNTLRDEVSKFLTQIRTDNRGVATAT